MWLAILHDILTCDLVLVWHPTHVSQTKTIRPFRFNISHADLTRCCKTPPRSEPTPDDEWQRFSLFTVNSCQFPLTYYAGFVHVCSTIDCRTYLHVLVPCIRTGFRCFNAAFGAHCELGLFFLFIVVVYVHSHTLNLHTESAFGFGDVVWADTHTPFHLLMLMNLWLILDTNTVHTYTHTRAQLQTQNERLRWRTTNWNLGAVRKSCFFCNARYTPITYIHCVRVVMLLLVATLLFAPLMRRTCWKYCAQKGAAMQIDTLFVDDILVVSVGTHNRCK